MQEGGAEGFNACLTSVAMCGSEYIAMAAWKAFCQLILVGALLTGCTAAAEGGLLIGRPETDAFCLSFSTSMLCSMFAESLMIVLGAFVISVSFLESSKWCVGVRQSGSAFAGLGCATPEHTS